jgi:hypothetical protein
VKVIATSGAYDGPHVPSGVLADAFYSKGRSSSDELLAMIHGVVVASVPNRDQEHAPVWIPRNGRDHQGHPFVVLNCLECLRSFPFSVDGEPRGELQCTPCIYCPNEIFYIIDFSRSVTSPEKRAEWKQEFLATHEQKLKDQPLAPAVEIKIEPQRPRRFTALRAART